MKNYNNFKDSNSTFNETIEAMTKVAIDYNKAKKYQKNSHNPSKTDLRYGKNKLGVSSNIRNSLLEKWKKLASNLQEGYLQYISSEPSLKTIENLKKLKKGEFNKMNKDSIDFDYDFYQVMDAAYEGEYDGELGQFDLPRFEKTEELIEKIWNEKYNDIDSWLEIPWTKEEKDQIFESARNEAKLFDRMDIYNSRARYQSYDETRNVLKEVFGIDNKYLHDSKYNSCLNNRKERGNKMNKDSISKKRSHKRDAFVSAFTDKRVKDWKQVLHIYLEWEGIIGYDDIIISYLENDEYDELREFLSDEGIYGYYYTIVDIFETGEVNIPDMDEEDYERFF